MSSPPCVSSDPTVHSIDSPASAQEPIGVVVAVSAFNHPLNLIVHQVLPAIAVGCPVQSLARRRAPPLSWGDLS